MTLQYLQPPPAGLLDLIGDIYQAGLEPQRWPEVLKRISAAFEADLACIYTPTVVRPEQAIYVAYNISVSSQTAFSAYYHLLDAWTQGALEQGLYIQGTIAFGEQLISPRDLHRTEFFQDFLKPNGMEWMISTALFDGHTEPNTPATHMTFTRHPDHAAFEQDKARLIKAIAPHVRRALLTHWRLTEARLRQAAHESALDRLGYGLILLGEYGQVLYLNGLAESMVGAADGLTIQANRLHAAHSHDNDALARMIREACLGVGGSLCLERAGGKGDACGHGGKPPYQLSAMPLREGQDLSAMGPHTTLSPPWALLLVHDPESSRPSDALHLFATRHRVTPAELRVLALLLQELAPKQIAAQIGVSIRTVRSQLSSLYLKTGTGHQRELIARVLRSA